ncbi:helix-turn-helix domain-containing protein [Enterococcus casseliflavus]|uniref:helix-turn-helix domain-containing protein n=1 Tax=Enterococcus casseliflavus TaxID=37734 RepID=UPI002DB72CB6|nr:helix-turn-helix transcriptional regulator [Enterococcus casseliflavus]MEB8400302.1 helix-turn-helix domain-containing protein [Enterococcus casseliflavus]
MEILVERIKQLCKSRSISVSVLENKIGLPTNTIYQWKKRVPGTDKLKKIADYFDVSIDYLLGRTDNPTKNSEIPKQLTVEEALASVMSSDGKPLTDNDRQILAGIIEAYMKNKTNAK